MVDTRFVLKITDHGYAEFLESHCSSRPQPAPEGQLGNKGPRVGCGRLVLVKQGKGVISSALPSLCWHLELRGAFLFWKNLRPLTWELRRTDALKSSQEQGVTAVCPSPVTAELLWTAPELLRGPGKATFKGDVFSLGIILQEVLTRDSPYCSWGLSAEGTCLPPLLALPAAVLDS